MCDTSRSCVPGIRRGHRLQYGAGDPWGRCRPMVTVLSDRGRFDVEGRASGDDLWVGTGDLERATGWQHKPEGLCQGDVCFPIPSSLAAELLADGEVNVAAFWR